MNGSASLYIAAAAAVEAVSDGVPKKRIHLMPLGTIQLRDGRGPFTLAGKEAADAVVEATRKRAGRTAIMVDYDHQSFYGAREGVGGQAPAAGWIDPASLSVEADGIWADVEWTDAAAAKLAAREYRYISPLFTFDPATKAVRAIANAGLTNTPAIEQLAAVASEIIQPENEMSFSKIALVLGLTAVASELECLAAAGALKQKADGLAAANAKLGLTEDAGVEQLVAAAARVDPAQYVPIAVVADLQKTVGDLQASIQGGKAEAAVAAAMKAGKVTPAMKDWAEGYARADLPGFESYVAAAAVIVKPGEDFADLGKAPQSDSKLTVEERAVAASMGLTEEQFLAAKEA